MRAHEQPTSRPPAALEQSQKINSTVAPARPVSPRIAPVVPAEHVPKATGHLPTRTDENRREPMRTASRINLVPVAPFSPGAGQSPQPGAGHWSAAPSTIHGRGLARARPKEFEGEPRRERRQASTPVGPGGRGNQPIDRGVDTISKQYQLCGARNSAPGSRRGRRSRRQGSTQDGNAGGGATWES